MNVIEARRLSKAFPGVKALTDVSLDVRKGEVHCLVGENGAGKSTFIKLITGALQPDGGEICIDGEVFHALTPAQAEHQGVQVIYQENLLVFQLSLAENLFIGREVCRFGGVMQNRRMRQEAVRLIESLDLDLSPDTLVEDLSVADQQFVKILRALVLNPRVLIMDEPTTMFNTRDAERVLQLVRTISERGIGVIYISHNLKEVGQIAHRISVLRDGHLVSTHENPAREMDTDLITREMVGRPVDLFYHRKRSTIGEVILEVDDLRLSPQGEPVSFKLHRGEVLGVAGMVGSGRTTFFESLFGARERTMGEIRYGGGAAQAPPRTPAEAISLGIGLIPEDRARAGLALRLSVAQNMTLAALQERYGFLLDLRQEQRDTLALIEKLSIRTPSTDQEVQFLSGGNQQKVVIGKWLYRECDILVFDEPTQGIDVNSKAEIYGLLSELAIQGKGIIIISSDLPELVSMSDRVLVVRNGIVTAELSGEAISEEHIIRNAVEV